MIPSQTSFSEPVITNNLFSSSLRKDSGDTLVKQPNDTDTISKQPLSLKKWRSAEQQVLSLLTFQGWTVADVSRQNIGYDLEGIALMVNEAVLKSN